MSQHDTLTLEPTRAAFERYFLESRKSKGANRKPTFELFEDGTYKDDHTQRHWWTWQNALSSTQPAQAAQSDWAAQQFKAPVYPPDGTESPFTVINLGSGKVQMGDSIHDGRLPALWFGINGQGMGHEETMNREARPGETLAVVTFANVEGLDVLLEVIQRIRREKFPEAQAAQGASALVLYRREIGEGDWAPCTPEQYAEACGNPHWDTKTDSVGQPAVAQGASEVFTALADHCPVDNGWFNGRAAQGEPVRHIGDSKFESWYQAHPKANGGDKQLARDAYAAGMSDPVAQGAGEVVAWAILVDDKAVTLLKSKGVAEIASKAGEVVRPLAYADTQPAAGADVQLLDAMERHRIAVVPEFEGTWDASVYGEEGEPQFIGSGDTPRDAIRAAIAASGRQE